MLQIIHFCKILSRKNLYPRKFIPAKIYTFKVFHLTFKQEWCWFTKKGCPLGGFCIIWTSPLPAIHHPLAKIIPKIWYEPYIICIIVIYLNFIKLLKQESFKKTSVPYFHCIIDSYVKCKLYVNFTLCYVMFNISIYFIFPYF